MSIPRLLILVAVFTSGCAAPGESPWPRLAFPGLPIFGANGAANESGGEASQSRGGVAQAGVFSFDWELAGDAPIMPVQVFDDGSRMWLQFVPGGAWPAVFHVSAQGWRPLGYRNEGPYMVLDAVYDALALRGGHLRGSVRRASAARGVAADSAPRVARDMAPDMALASPPAQGLPVHVSPVSPPARDLPAPGTAAHVGKPVTDITRQAVVPASDALSKIAPGAATPAAASDPVMVGSPVPIVTASLAIDPERPSLAAYSVGPSDVTMRQALERWAATAGWTFSSEHWAVDVDIPLVGQATFEADFRTAVRELLAATELGDRALQPCFYSNRVLRVVPYAQACDRRRGTGVVS
jgi:hypothetical protein